MTDVWPHMHKLLKAFGPERLVFASDFTRMRMAPGTTERGRRDQWAALYSDSVNYLRDTTKVSSKELWSLLRWPRTDTTPRR